MSEPINKNLNDGYVCSCCGQFVKQYSRKINSSMALTLIEIYKSGKRNFFHVENWLKDIGRPELRADYHKLRFWGFLEKQIGKREDESNRNGFYKITGRGIMFAENKLSVPNKAMILNNKFQGFEGDEVTISQCINSRFRYDELMGIMAAGAKTEKQQKRSSGTQDLFANYQNI